MEEMSKRGNNNNNNNNNRFENLPTEIIWDIFVRLPIEWIMSCKCVCKTWYAFIKHNSFVKFLLTVTKDRLILDQNPLNFHKKSGVHKLFFLDIPGKHCQQLPSYPLPIADDKFRYGGIKNMSSLDGLVCAARPDNPNPVFIYNPLIKTDYISLPDSWIVKHFPKMRYQHITLGYDLSINKYKAVRMMTYKSSDNVTKKSLCEVITVGEAQSSWMPIDFTPYPVITEPFYRGGVFHQGSMYWIIDKLKYSSRTAPNRKYILELDLTKEVFRSITFPRSIRAPKYRMHLDLQLFHMQLHVLQRGSLALMEYDGQLLHIWRIAKQNGNGNRRRPVVTYSSIMIELPYNNARLLSLFYLNGDEDSFFLQFHGCLGQNTKNNKLPPRKVHFYHYRPYNSNKNDRGLVNLTPSVDYIQPPYFVYLSCFKPSLVSVQAAAGFI